MAEQAHFAKYKISLKNNNKESQQVNKSTSQQVNKSTSLQEDRRQNNRLNFFNFLTP